MMASIPHGGRLVTLLAEQRDRADLARKASGLPRLVLTARQMSDLELLVHGALSPLEGFMGSAEFESVLSGMRLPSGLIWSIPITLATSRETASQLREGGEVALADPSGRPVALLALAEKFPHKKEPEALSVYGTADPKHPGVAYVLSMPQILLGGKVIAFSDLLGTDFSEFRLTPSETRGLFEERGWKRIVAFQTRNPIHRAHEYIQKCALEIADGLLVHPIVGETKGDDISAEVRMRCYRVLLDNYYPKERTLLAVFPASMRYAGPREAIFHAMIRKNYGCTHFIVGRDHAGVGNYYGPFDAQKIFHRFTEQELGITPLFFDNTFYCRRCLGMVSAKTCPHDATEHIALSGTKVREMLIAGIAPPPEFTRPEVAAILIEAMRDGTGPKP